MKRTASQTAAARWNLKNLPAESPALRTALASSSRAVALSRQWRSESGGFLTQRRAVAALSLAAIGAMGLISLYQLGILKHLPHPHVSPLDSDQVDGSPEAYKRLSTPDGTLGTASYAGTLVLAAMGGKERAEEHHWIPLALAGKVAFDLLQALRMIGVQWTQYRAFCIWSLGSALATFATVPLVFGEARASVRRLVGLPTP